MADSTDPKVELPDEWQKLVDDAIERMRMDMAWKAYELGRASITAMELAWDECAKEAFANGFLHEANRDEMFARNPYRTKEQASEG